MLQCAICTHKNYNIVTINTWLEVERPYIKLLSPAKPSSPSRLRNGCKKAMLAFSVPRSALSTVGQPTDEAIHEIQTFV